MSEFVMLDLTTPAGVAMPAALTIREAEKIQSQLLQAVREQENIVVDCSAATDVDLSFVQLVLAARKSAAALGKKLSVIPPASSVLSDVLWRAGILPSASDPPPAEQSFWCN
ncbi:STAS domain-containing protein [Xanthobacteraceae bacterium Astr-EGSB]|uniref:STAS domain-containing protein n=1 Tax=Astrobacterium formosum TaxID=3069710 RepID=UPI0027B6CA76|nr:STAS domain-containing protein [Xanthobacteraceae bacterium Astr-EGSB]